MYLDESGLPLFSKLSIYSFQGLVVFSFSFLLGFASCRFVKFLKGHTENQTLHFSSFEPNMGKAIYFFP